MSPTERIGEELRRALDNLRRTEGKTPLERKRDAVGGLALASLVAWLMVAALSSIHFPGFSPVEDTPFILVKTLAGPAYWILLAWWVYLDAKIRGINAAPWGLLTLFTNIFGFLTYLIVRGPEAYSCWNCGRGMRAGQRACPYCGAQQARTCPSCGEKVEGDWQFCPSCAGGLPRTGPVEPLPPAPPPPPQALGPEPAAPWGDRAARVVNDAARMATSAAKFGVGAAGVGARAAQKAAEAAVESVKATAASIWGTVVDLETGAPIPGAEVTLDISGSDAPSVKTDARGAYSLPNLPQGPYVLVARAPGYREAVRPCEHGALGTAVDIRLARE